MDLKNTAKHISAAITKIIVSMMNGFYYNWMMTWLNVFGQDQPKGCLLFKYHSPLP
jgi:hypothetical protein